MTIERIFPSGAWRVSDIIAGYLVSRQYFGYTKREAIAAFKEETI
jgi:hypothetical protein